MEIIIKLLALIGVCTLGVCAIVAITEIMDKVCEHIRYKKWRERVAHRFDGSPTAKCWCKDCYFFAPYQGENRGTCIKLKDRVEDDNFCYWANPYMQAERRTDVDRKAETDMR